MRRILLAAAALIVGLILIALILPVFLPSEAYRGQIQRAATEALGRETDVAGRIGVSLIPRIQVSAADVSVANAEGFGDAPFAEMGALRLSVDLFPLLSGRISVNELVLVDPVVRLSQRGSDNNWTFQTGGDAAPQASGEGFVRRPGALPIEATLGDVRLENGLVIYSDGQTEHRIENLDVAVEMDSVDDPARVSGGLQADGETLTFDLRLDSLRGFFEGARTPVNARFGGDLVAAEFDGAFLESSDIDFEGFLSLALTDLQRLSAVAGAALPEGDVFRRFNAEGDVTGSPTQLSFDNAELAFDDITATGAFSARLDAARPKLTGELVIPELDVTPYAAGGEAGAAPAQPSEGGWSEEPVDLSALRLVDADLSIQAGTLRYGEIEVNDAALEATLEDGRLTADLSRFNLYSGQGSARLVANARQDTPSYSLQADLDALNALPFMQAAAGFDRLEGIGSLSLDVASQGASPADIMNALNGQGRFDFSDGAIKGVNLARVIRGVQTALETGELPQGFGDTEATDFSSLGGTINIADGVAANPDLALLSPLLRVQGEGSLNLLEQSIDYRLTPRAVADLTGQGGEADLNGVPVPIRIRGSMTSPSISLDLERIMRSLVQSQAGGLIGGEAGQALSEGRSVEDVLRDEAANALFNALGGRRGQAEDEDQDAETPPAEEPPAR